MRSLWVMYLLLVRFVVAALAGSEWKNLLVGML